MRSLVENCLPVVAAAWFIGAASQVRADEGAPRQTVDDGAMQATAQTEPGWHEIVIEADRDLRFRRAIADGEGGLWVLYTRRQKRSAIDEGDLHLMRIDADGRRTADLSVAMPVAPTTRRSGSAVALTLGADGRPAVLTSTDTGIALIEPAVAPGQVSRSRSLDIDALPLGLQAAGDNRYRVVTNEAVMMWSGKDEPQIEFATGEDQVFVAATPSPDGFVVLHAHVSDDRFDRLEAGRITASDVGALEFRRIDQGGQPATLFTRLAADAGLLAVFGPVEKGPPSRWQSTIFDRNMNLLRSGLVTLPFEVNWSTTLAMHLLERGNQLLASVDDGKPWLARLDTDGELHLRSVPAHLLPPKDETRLMSDMEWVAMPGTDRVMLVSTVVILNPQRDMPDHGLWFASIALAD
jgi:hypothetical protein